MEKRQWTFKAIVADGDNWESDQAEYAEEVTADQKREVEKMLECGDESNGFATYICLDCGEAKRVGFSCKSRVCSSCGKVYADEWAEELAGRLFNVTHRHITMTVASELWPKLEADETSRKVLFEAADATLKGVMKNNPGIVVTLHPYGKDLKVNYHVHALLTEGGLDEEGHWQAQSYISYAKLRMIWQYEVLTRRCGVLPVTQENKALIDQLFVKYPKGFYVNGEPKVKDGKGVGRYIGRYSCPDKFCPSRRGIPLWVPVAGRHKALPLHGQNFSGYLYLRHPAIADSRIVADDGAAVTIVYKGPQETPTAL